MVAFLATCCGHLLKSIGTTEEAGAKNWEMLAAGLRSLPGAVYVVEGLSENTEQSFALLTST